MALSELLQTGLMMAPQILQGMKPAAKAPNKWQTLAMGPELATTVYQNALKQGQNEQDLALVQAESMRRMQDMQMRRQESARQAEMDQQSMELEQRQADAADIAFNAAQKQRAIENARVSKDWYSDPNTGQQFYMSAVEAQAAGREPLSTYWDKKKFEQDRAQFETSERNATARAAMSAGRERQSRLVSEDAIGPNGEIGMNIYDLDTGSAKFIPGASGTQRPVPPGQVPTTGEKALDDERVLQRYTSRFPRAIDSVTQEPIASPEEIFITSFWGTLTPEERKDQNALDIMEDLEAAMLQPGTVIRNWDPDASVKTPFGEFTTGKVWNSETKKLEDAKDTTTGELVLLPAE